VKQRLRGPYDDAKLAEIYARPHDHTRWNDHKVRIAVTVQLAHALVGRVSTAADLSCGDGATLKALGVPTMYLGDYAPGYPFHGPIEQTIHEIPDVDLFVCTETLEHVDDPDLVLRSIRPKTQALILSTPVDCWGDHNPEHYWAWSRRDVEEMLGEAGFTVAVYAGLDMRPGGGEYEFGIWGCR
jgi:hypothetical protein